MQAKRAEGCEDLIGKRMRDWESMQKIAAQSFEPYGFSLVETPIMEQVDVFVHGIGQSTDVVRKEMFRVVSGANYQKVLSEGSEASLKPKQRLALRPEGTAGFIRAVVENNLVPAGAAPLKAYYAGPMFRGERVQKGRLRQFHQIGLEWVGAADEAADAETIIMLMKFYQNLGLDKEKMTLYINSIGCLDCRAEYREKLKSYILNNAERMSEDDLARVETNPLRTFDSKNEATQQVMSKAPRISEHLCEECARSYQKVRDYLDLAGLNYTENPALVRGLDYYTGVVFEVQVTSGLGSQSAIGGGGRYDGLVEIEGGKPTPAVGFAVGFERIMLALDDQGVTISPDTKDCVYIASPEPELRKKVFELALSCREQGIYVECDYQGRSLKSQFKQADKLSARFCVVVGSNELAEGKILLRDMRSHEQRDVLCAELASELARCMS